MVVCDLPSPSYSLNFQVTTSLPFLLYSLFVLTQISHSIFLVRFFYKSLSIVDGPPITKKELLSFWCSLFSPSNIWYSHKLVPPSPSLLPSPSFSKTGLLLPISYHSRNQSYFISHCLHSLDSSSFSSTLSRSLSHGHGCSIPFRPLTSHFPPPTVTNCPFASFPPPTPSSFLLLLISQSFHSLHLHSSILETPLSLNPFRERFHCLFTLRSTQVSSG